MRLRPFLLAAVACGTGVAQTIDTTPFTYAVIDGMRQSALLSNSLFNQSMMVQVLGPLENMDLAADGFRFRR